MLGLLTKFNSLVSFFRCTWRQIVQRGVRERLVKVPEEGHVAQQLGQAVVAVAKIIEGRKQRPLEKEDAFERREEGGSGHLDCRSNSEMRCSWTWTTAWSSLTQLWSLKQWKRPSKTCQMFRKLSRDLPRVPPLAQTVRIPGCRRRAAWD